MKKILLLFSFLSFCQNIIAQEAFIIKHYNIDLRINKDASLDFTETIHVNFTEQRHGIIRSIQYKYPMETIPEGIEQADRQLTDKGFTRIMVENIKVPGNEFSVNKTGNYTNIKIGSADKYVNDDQLYVIKYRVLNAINFFKNHAELYYNLVGNGWATTIDSVTFKVELPEPLSDRPNFFVATGVPGSKDNKTSAQWTGGKIFSGHSTAALNPNEGLTIGISFPAGFLNQTNYTYRKIWWLLLPVFVFFMMYKIWEKWGKDEKVTVQTEFYPPENISPSVSGYVIDDKLDQRDLTALIPFWGAGGFLQVNEIEKSSLLGLLKNKDYEFIKKKELNLEALQFEKTLFNGIFKTGNKVKLSDLKDVLYSTMNEAKTQLESEIQGEDYYVKYSRGLGCFLPLIGVVAAAFGIFAMIDDFQEKRWMGIALIASGLFIVIFGLFMTKKTKKGTELYQKLLGFKEFIKSVEKDRLQEFLKQDENYFDKVLPYAIVFDMADKWKDKLKGLEIPPPNWYSGNYGGSNFSTAMFMTSLDHSMNQMTQNFYSAPQSSGSSGGSFGGGGSSGGGFGGGGGSSW